MSSRAELVNRWEAQLQASESHVAEGPPRLRWLWHMRVRLYRFLLRCYGDTQWEPAADTLTDQLEPATRPGHLIDNTASTLGLRPKSPERIRSTLKSVHVANDRIDAPGPYADGGFHCEWIRVANFRDSAECEPLTKELKAEGIEFLVRRIRWGYLVVEIRRMDFDAALEGFNRVRPLIALIRATRQFRQQSTILLVQVALFTIVGLALLVASVVGPVEAAWPCFGGALFCLFIMWCIVDFRCRLLARLKALLGSER